MPQNLTFDLVVIGGGPAGYVGAIRAAQLGMTVACIERDKLGGVCLNWGCIPTKALLAGAQFYQKLQHDAADWGIEADNIRHDWTKVIARSRRVADNLNKGVAFLFKKNKITHVHGQAQVVAGAPASAPGSTPASAAGNGPTCKVQVSDPADPANVTHAISAKHIVIATGAGPRQLPGAPFDGQRVISYKEAMILPDQPEALLIVGAGAIGMEFAYFYNAFGTNVTVIEMLPRLLPVEDEEVSKAIGKSFRKQGITCLTATKTTAVKKTDTGVELTVAPATGETSGSAGGGSEKQKSRKLVADKVLVAIGVEGRYDGLFDDKLGLAIDKHHIKVDRRTYQTSVPGVFAVGDVIGPPWLAHLASEEAIVCIEQIAGHQPTPIDYDSIPGCTYCHPQVASIGLTEQACKDRGIEYKTGKFPLQASGKAQALGETEGFVKIISDAATGEILGCHMIGENVTELIAEIGLARRLEATAEELIATIHAHPTLSESIHEAAMGTQGRMIHF